jgi:hypothetical protein
VPYRIQVRCALGSVPTATVGRLRARLREIGQSLATVSESSAFWASMTEAPLHADVDGWRFRYTIERRARLLVVVEVIRVSDVRAAYERAKAARTRW